MTTDTLTPELRALIPTTDNKVLCVVCDNIFDDQLDAEGHECNWPEWAKPILEAK